SHQRRRRHLGGRKGRRLQRPSGPEEYRSLRQIAKKEGAVRRSFFQPEEAIAGPAFVTLASETPPSLAASSYPKGKYERGTGATEISSSLSLDCGAVHRALVGADLQSHRAHAIRHSL